MKMVTEWYRAFRFQVCPRSRFLEFHLNGVGVERREVSAAQVASELIRLYIGTILDKQFSAKDAGDCAYTDFLNVGRKRGFYGSKNNFTEAKEVAWKIQKVLENFAFDPSFTVVIANKPMSVQFTDDIRFYSTPVAVVSKETGAYYLYFVKVTSSWRDDRREAMARDNQLLSEMYVAKTLCSGDFAGAIVQVISLSKAVYEVPFMVSWDEKLTTDWAEEAGFQEQRVEMLADSVVANDPSRTAVEQGVAFAQHRHACSFPYPCQMNEICWGDLQNEPHPENDPRFMPREIKLVSEKELVASWKSQAET